MEEDYYELLGVYRDAKPEEIRRAYLRKAREWHPDVTSHSKEEANRMFILLGRAYETLSNPVLRTEYDKRNPTAGVRPWRRNPIEQPTAPQRPYYVQPQPSTLKERSSLGGVMAGVTNKLLEREYQQAQKEYKSKAEKAGREEIWRDFLDWLHENKSQAAAEEEAESEVETGVLTPPTSSETEVSPEVEEALQEFDWSAWDQEQKMAEPAITPELEEELRKFNWEEFEPPVSTQREEETVTEEEIPQLAKFRTRIPRPPAPVVPPVPRLGKLRRALPIVGEALKPWFKTGGSV
jgi:hypothetical protein